MAWRISGTYLATCSCQLLCPCPVDGPPTGPGGECHGNLVFQVREGNLDAVDKIMRGQEGGPFEMFASLYGTYIGTERGEVSFSDGDTPSFSIRGNSFSFEPLPGPEGSNAQTTVKNAAFGFAPEFRVGKSSGHSDVFDIEFDAVYG